MVKAPRRRWRTFKQARVFVRKLNLKSNKNWRAWRKTKRRPANIPSNPHKVYRDSGWVSYPDFLGYTRSKHDATEKDFLPFKQARVFARKLNLKSQKEWEAWAKTKHRPANIPSNPDQVYRDSGWVSLPDFLGYKGTRLGIEKDFLPFKHARVFARNLKLKSQKEWWAWRKTKHRPANISSCPDQVYRDSGWVSYPDFLGYKSRYGGFLPFKQARVFARKLKLKRSKEWKAWAKTKHRPANIPSCPSDVYRDSGWVSFPDFLGYKPRSKHEAQRHVRVKATSTCVLKKSSSKKRKRDDSERNKNKPEREEEEEERENDCCSTCWADLSTVPVVRMLPCKHVFCGPCLDAWARQLGQEEGKSRLSRSTAGARSVLISCPTCRDRSRYVFISSA